MEKGWKRITIPDHMGMVNVTSLNAREASNRRELRV